MLQNNPVIIKIKKGITNKILNELSLLAKNDKEKFNEFWKNFGDQSGSIGAVIGVFAPGPGIKKTPLI